ncbi:MAG: DUF6702 family protein [Cyclobacteriaceae bacterium]
MLHIQLYISSIIFLVSHPIHLSVTNVDINRNNASMEISMRIFRDDLGFAIGHRYDKQVNLMDSDFSKNEKSLMVRYINDMFLILADKDTVALSFKEVKENNEALFLLFSTEFNPGLKQLTIKNLLLLDLYLDQKNLLILGYDGKEKGYEFNARKQEKSLELD